MKRAQIGRKSERPAAAAPVREGHRFATRRWVFHSQQSYDRMPVALLLNTTEVTLSIVSRNLIFLSVRGVKWRSPTSYKPHPQGSWIDVPYPYVRKSCSNEIMEHSAIQLTEFASKHEVRWPVARAPSSCRMAETKEAAVGPPLGPCYAPRATPKVASRTSTTVMASF